MEVLSSDQAQGPERRQRFKSQFKGRLLGSRGEVSMGTMDSTSGKLAFLAFQLHF